MASTQSNSCGSRRVVASVRCSARTLAWRPSMRAWRAAHAVCLATPLERRFRVRWRRPKRSRRNRSADRLPGDQRSAICRHRGSAAENYEKLAVETPRNGIARKDPDVRHTPQCGPPRSFGFALEGVSYDTTQRSAQIEIAIGAAGLRWPRGFGSRLEGAVSSWRCVVLALEALNTAVELA